MFNDIKMTRLGAMSSAVRIFATTDLRKAIADQIKYLTVNHWLAFDQKVYSVFLFLESSYLGCLRFNRDTEFGDIVYLKMYNEHYDDSRAIIAKVSCCLQMDCEPFFTRKAPEFDRLDTILDYWYESQFLVATDDSVKSITKDSDDVDWIIVNKTVKGVPDIDQFLKVAEERSYADEDGPSVAVLFQNEHTELSARAIIYAGGGGEIWRKQSELLYYPNGDLKKPAIWRRVFSWDDYPREVDVMRTERILISILTTGSTYNQVQVFPTEKH